MRRRPLAPRRASPALLLAGLCAVAAGAPAVAGPTSLPWGPAQTYERGRTVEDALLFVAKDLALRARSEATKGPAQLLLVVDATPRLAPTLRRLAAIVGPLQAAGPPGLLVGVVAAGSDSMAPAPDPVAWQGALLRHALVPVPGAKNLHASVRRALGLFGPGTPRALVLITRDGAEAEDDVEATRSALRAADAAFYSIAPEAAFERSWILDFAPRTASGLSERFQPEPPGRGPATLYYGGDVALGLVPYRWELDLAQTEFVWSRPPAYPVPSGFGTWALATLAYATGGRYFVTDFDAPASPGPRKASPGRLPYDYSRLALFVPDLRPRDEIRRDLSKDDRARAIVRIWTRLADEACPVIGAHGTLEEVGGALATRPARSVRARTAAPGWLEDMRDVRKALDVVESRRASLAKPMRWWEAVDGKPRPVSSEPGPLRERLEADFALLGVFLEKVDLEWALAKDALQRIKPLYVTYRRVRLKPVVIARGHERTREVLEMTREREARLLLLLGRIRRLEERYPDTPWALLLEKGWVVGYDLEIEVIDPEAAAQAGGVGGGRPARPAPGARPGSSTNAPATEGR